MDLKTAVESIARAPFRIREPIDPQFCGECQRLASFEAFAEPSIDQGGTDNHTLRHEVLIQCMLKPLKKHKTGILINESLQKTINDVIAVFPHALGPTSTEWAVVRASASGLTGQSLDCPHCHTVDSVRIYKYPTRDPMIAKPTSVVELRCYHPPCDFRMAFDFA